MKKLNRKGFTIVELVIVIAIIAILAAVMIPTFSGVMDQAKESAAFQSATHVKTTLLAITDADLDEVSGSAADYYIVADGYVYQIVDGDMTLVEDFEEDDIVLADDAAVGAGYYATYTHADLEEYDAVVYKYAGVKA